MSSSPRLVVIAASAGGLPAIVDVLAPLPADFPAAIAIVQHRGESDPELLIGLLARRTRLRVKHATSGTVLEAGTVYVCPPGMHMTTEHSLHLSTGPHVDFVRPNADLMFDSVARAYGERAIGVVLSGSGSDAALGSLAIANAGGTILAQDGRTTSFASMPMAAAAVGAVSAILTPAEIALELQRLTDKHYATACATERATIDVVLADDHQIVLEGLQVLLSSESDLRVVASTGDGATAIQAARELSPDVVVMDIRMPGMDGIEAARAIIAENANVRVIALSAEHDAASVDRMLRVGAAGYVTKHRAFEDLVQAIHTVVKGRPYLCQEIARLVRVGAVAAPTPPRSRPY